MKVLIPIVVVVLLTGCGVRLPDDFEYNLRVIADSNEEILERINSGEIGNADREKDLLKSLIESDIRDFRNAANTVEAGR